MFDDFYNSKWVKLLKSNQLSVGGFGRFHTRDSKIKQKFLTTEIAIDSIKLLGLERGISLIDRLCDYMERILRRDIDWPDGYDKNQWYRPAQPLFVASKLSIFGSRCEEFLEVFNCWLAILQEAFRDGEYSKDRTDKISKKLLGCEIDGSYIGLNSIYVIELLANMQAHIGEELKQNYLKWLHNNGKSIGYTSVFLNRGLNNDFTELYKVYFILSKYSCFKYEFEKELNSLKEKRDRGGFWNFGKNFSCQKLLDDWRSLDRMKTDQTVMCLCLYK